MKVFSIFLVNVVFPTLLFAELSVPSFFSDHMVLQQGRDVKIWGKADQGQEVKVSFKGATASAKSSDDGTWSVNLTTGEADHVGAPLTITAGEESIAITDVIVGEVWFASGQSNMVFSLDRIPDYNALVAATNLPGLRMFNAPLVTAENPQENIDGNWTLCSPAETPKFSAVAFFFAKKLHEELGVPVGVIKSAWGGKPVETFTSREALSSVAETKSLVADLLASEEKYDLAAAQQRYEKRKATHQEAYQKWKTTKEGRRPKAPSAPKRPIVTEGKPGVLYNAMIHPFVGYTIQGAIWYQGEGNAKAGKVPYDITLPLLIRDWRGRWGDDFDFNFVQLANFRKPTTEPGAVDPWPLLQDRMRLVLDTTPKTGMAIINDVGEADDIHPKNKKDPGERLARWALAKTYGKEWVYSGPLYQSNQIDGGSITVSFESVGSGLKSRDGGPLKRFEIAGEDKKWHWAEAEIVGTDQVKLSSANVPSPVAVRYAWASNPEGANLINSDGLPTSVFRTDDWDDVVSKVIAQDRQVKQEKRRALAVEIKALREERKKVERGSEAFNEIQKKWTEKAAEFKKLTPAQ